MYRRIINLRNVALTACFAVSSVMFSSCEDPEDFIMCVTKEQYEMTQGRVYGANCIAAEHYLTCDRDVAVDAKRYNSKKSCEEDRAFYRQNGPNADPGGGGNGGGGGNNSPMCSGGYVDPKGGDIQTNSNCEMAYNYICRANMSPSSDQVKQLCDIFKTWQSMDSKLENCKYCQ